MSVPFAHQPGISGIFDRMESAPRFEEKRKIIENEMNNKLLRQSNSGGEVGGFDRVSRMNFKTCHLLFELLLTIRFHKLTHHVSLLAVKVFRRDAAGDLYRAWPRRIFNNQQAKEALYRYFAKICWEV